MNPAIGPASMIDEFLDGYRSELLDRTLTVDERAIAEEVLFDFLTTDQEPNQAILPQREINNLRSVVAILPKIASREAERDLAEIEQRMIALSIEAQQRERAHDIMQEHLVMLSTRQ